MVQKYLLLTFSIILPLSLKALNRLSNPGFEISRNGIPNYWRAAKGWKGKSEYSLDSQNAVEGKNAAVIERKIDDKGAGAFLSDYVPVKSGEYYFISGNIKSENVTGRADIALNFYNAANKSIKYKLLAHQKKTVPWQKKSFKIKAPAGAVKARLLLVLSGTGKVSFDDFYFGAEQPTDATVTAVKAISADGNMAENGNFKKLNTKGIPEAWYPAYRWKGKSLYSAENSTVKIQRPEPGGAGAWKSKKIAVKGGEVYCFRGEIKTSRVTGRADFALSFYNAKGKSIQYRLLAKLTGTNKWTAKQKNLRAPLEAVSVVIMLVQSGTGETSFRNIYFGTEIPDMGISKKVTNLILNSSFEEADLNPEFIDCFKIVEGKAFRSRLASHGFHALQLAPRTKVVYGTSTAPPLALKGGSKLYYNLSVHGSQAVSLKLQFFDHTNVLCGQKQLELSGKNSDYKQNSGFFSVPNGARFATLNIENNSDKNTIVDSLYIGTKPFDKKLLPRPVPVLPPLKIPENMKKIPVSKVKDYRGVPTWFLGGKPIVNSIFTLCANTLRNTKWQNYNLKVLRTGQFPLIMLCVYMTPEKAGEKYTTASALRKADNLIRFAQSALPNAKFIIWIYQESAFKLAADYPDQILEVEDKSFPWSSGVPPYSYGSEIWGRMCARSIKYFIQELRSRPYGDKIVGIMPGMGKYGENNFGHAHLRGGYSAHDFSFAMQNFFRKWLFREYKYNVRLFDKTWKRKNFNFSDAGVPSSIQRLIKYKGAFFDPARQRNIIDYARCESTVISHRLLQQVKAAKEASDGNIFTILQLAYFSESFFQRELDAALKSPYLDSLGPAPPYINRGPGDDIIDHGPAASVRQANKVWLFQADVRTHLCGKQDWRYGRTKNVKESIAILLRDLGHYMTTGTIPYYMTFGYWYENPEIWKLVAEFEPLMQLSGYFPRRSAAEIAVVTDSLSLSLGHEYSYTRRTMPPHQSTLSYNRMFEWHHLGTPYDYYMLDELLKVKNLKQYKLIIMANTFALSPEQRKLIKERLHKDNRTVLYLYAPGLMKADKTQIEYNVKNCSFSGFKFKLDESKHDLSIKLKSGNVAGYFRNKIYGGFTTPQKPKSIRREKFSPRLIVKPQPGVKILGHYADDGAIAFASKKQANFISVFWGSTCLNAEVLRKIAKNAGVNIYADYKAVVYANNNFMSIHVPEAGKRTIKLPRRVEQIVDLYTGQELVRNTDRISVNFAKNDSRLLYFGKADALEKAQKEVRAIIEARKKADLAIAANYVYKAVKPPLLAKPAAVDADYKPDGSGFIKHWLIAGPFPNYDKNPAFDVDCLKSTGGETGTRPDTQQEYQAVFDARGNNREAERNQWFNGKSIKKELRVSWRPIAFSKGIITPLYRQIDSFMTFDKICYYAACYINVKKDTQAILCIGSDDGNKVYVNGKLVTKINVPQGRGLRPDSEKTLVKLHKGSNLILVKILQGGGGLGHAMRFKNPDNGNIFKDFIIKLKK